jgi:hypothetical protein
LWSLRKLPKKRRQFVLHKEKGITNEQFVSLEIFRRNNEYQLTDAEQNK